MDPSCSQFHPRTDRPTALATLLVLFALGCDLEDHAPERVHQAHRGPSAPADLQADPDRELGSTTDETSTGEDQDPPPPTSVCGDGVVVLGELCDPGVPPVCGPDSMIMHCAATLRRVHGRPLLAVRQRCARPRRGVRRRRIRRRVVRHAGVLHRRAAVFEDMRARHLGPVTTAATGSPTPASRATAPTSRIRTASRSATPPARWSAWPPAAGSTPVSATGTAPAAARPGACAPPSPPRPASARSPRRAARARGQRSVWPRRSQAAAPSVREGADPVSTDLSHDTGSPSPAIIGSSSRHECRSTLHACHCASKEVIVSRR
jgi:hypothetical protein